MARVTISFPLELRDLSLHLTAIREQRALSARSAKASRSRETRDRMVEQTKMDTGSPCSGNPSLNHEFRLRGCSKSSGKRESVRGKQAHHQLHSAINQVGHRQRESFGRDSLERKLSFQELHHYNKLYPDLFSQHLALISEHLYDSNYHQRSDGRDE
jgi:hypothetical protein